MSLLRNFKHQGLGNAIRQLLRERKVCSGALVGIDEVGNKYYEDNTLIFGGNRRVDYADKDFNASQVPGEWHRWLHHITDDVPSEPAKQWQLPHMENYTATPNEYVPYSTTKPKIQAWDPNA